ncbi:hypothetical protein RHGRI_006617 [Rhododendron griersonianum]|uniref:Uncharacterized protein n=1 Tax=Rhododendron griersonianum TaxID=479676 RepID=A0AAV6KTU4_9ERIC|nr:hypothetical protein RHGRI_006617 [Rhododendron griersonianum]
MPYYSLHTHPRNLRHFNVSENCPVFDGLFPFCQATAALPSRVLPLITNDGGATITNDAPSACHQRRWRILSTALPGSRSSSSPPRSSSSCFVDAAAKLNCQDIDIVGSSPPPDSSMGAIGDRIHHRCCLWIRQRG